MNMERVPDTNPAATDVPDMTSSSKSSLPMPLMFSPGAQMSMHSPKKGCNKQQNECTYDVSHVPQSIATYLFVKRDTLSKDRKTTLTIVRIISLVIIATCHQTTILESSYADGTRSGGAVGIRYLQNRQLR